MSIQSTGLSKHEKRARRGATPIRGPPAEERSRQRDLSILLPKPEKPRLLYSRKQARELLGGISERTIKTLEDEGRLEAVRLRRAAGPVYYRHQDLLRIAQGLRDDDDD